MTIDISEKYAIVVKTIFIGTQSRLYCVKCLVDRELSSERRDTGSRGFMVASRCCMEETPSCAVWNAAKEVFLCLKFPRRSKNQLQS